MTFYFKNTKKDNIMTKQDKEDFEIMLFVDFVKKKHFPKKSEINVI